MVYSLTWLPDVLQRAGLKFSEVPEWRTRGRGDMARVRGVMVHHTAGAATGNMPSLDLLVRGRPDLNGPLAQLGLGRDGTFYIIGAGRANHAGPGKWRGITTGNSSFVGIEVENTGKPADAYPAVQLDALRRGTAAILKHIGEDASMVCGHKEYALPMGRKPDPLFDMAPFREAVSTLLAGGVPPAPQIAAVDDKSRPTLRRGARGPMVVALQQLLGIAPATGNFGPVTEARLREWQRTKTLVPDGIAGPRTWAMLDPAPTPGAVQVPITAATTASELGVTGSVVAAVAAAFQQLPPADDAAHPVRVDDGRIFAPDGTRFGTQIRQGFQSLGRTGVVSFIAAHPQAGAGVSASALRALSAVMENEGKLEAVNSYDNSFMSFGVMQWTAGEQSNDGELAALLARIRSISQPAFDECFGRFGLGATAAAGSPTGRLSLNGVQLSSAADKAVLRSKEWAYRFWRAGHDSVVRTGQIVHGASRIARFADKAVHGFAVRQWMSSELGMAMMLDQHVNRPGHVPATLEKAVKARLDAGAPPNPANWTQSHEDRLIERYVAFRALTSMTHSTDRAQRLTDLAEAGKLSAKRGSFA